MAESKLNARPIRIIEATIPGTGHSTIFTESGLSEKYYLLGYSAYTVSWWTWYSNNVISDIELDGDNLKISNQVASITGRKIYIYLLRK